MKTMTCVKCNGKGVVPVSDHEDRIIKIIHDHLNPGIPIVAEHHLVNDFGADSLDEIEMLMTLEEEFDIEVTDDNAASLKTAGDVYAYVLSVIA